VTETFHLNASGPHSAEHTLHAANALAESMRVLNHATRARAGVPDPQTVYEVLGRIAFAIAGLDQVLPQLVEQLARFNADGRLADDSDDPVLPLATAVMHIDAATAMAAIVARQLSAGHTATAGLYLRDGDR
jgi:hypothetical protein